MGSRVSFLRKVENKSPEIFKEGVMIPLAAVAIKDDHSVVQALDGSKIRFTKVEVAERTANYARVIDGLKSGMTVVAIFDDELEDNQQERVK